MPIARAGFLRLACGLLTLITLLGGLAVLPGDPATADEPAPCLFKSCPDPPPVGGPSDPGAAYPRVVQQMVSLGGAEQRGTVYLAGDSPSADQWVWQIEPMCAVRGGDCLPGEFCAGADQGVYMRIQVRPLAQPGPSAPGAPPPGAPGNIAAFGPPFAGTPVGSPYGSWLGAGEGCVNIDGLNLPPTPEEVYEQFILLPIPGLGFSVQPVDLGLVNLPEIFYTTEPTTGQYTVGIRGYTVVLSTRVAQFNWYTGDPAEPVVVSYGPGLPWPYQYVTHTYLARGDYPAQLETYWQATYTIDGGPSYAAPGNVRTVGPARTISVVEAHAVLTDPYD